MNLPHGHVDDLAKAVAEHASVSWDDELRQAETEQERALIEELRTLFYISEVPSETLLPPAKLGDFRILREIGRGSMGVVYEALQVSLDRRVALKILSPEATQNALRVQRFKQEARALASLEHPNIVTVHTVDTVDDLHYLTMELIKGTPLTERIPRNGVPLETFFELAIPLADALSTAHQFGITHRDLKPANIMVTDDGRTKVLDFGLAKLRGLESPRIATTEPAQDRTVTIGSLFSGGDLLPDDHRAAAVRGPIGGRGDGDDPPRGSAIGTRASP